MKLESTRQTIKEIRKWRYVVTLQQDAKSIYYITSTNFFTNKTQTISLVDYNMASNAFDNKVTYLEGN